MTRINVGVDAWELPDKLLLAEHREITRIPNAVRRLSPSLDDLPPVFCLGRGHVRFFYNKLAFLRLRYVDLRVECERRGFAITAKDSAFESIPFRYCGTYKPTEADRALIVARIESKGFKLLRGE